MNKCPECGSRVVEENGERYCDTCGLVIEDSIISTSKEWRIYDPEHLRRERVGSPLTQRHHIFGLGTYLERLTSSKERSLIYLFTEVDRICNALHLPLLVREEAGSMLHHLKKTHDLDALAAAVVYIAARKCKVTRSLKEVAEVARCPYKKIVRMLHSLKVKLPPPSPHEYIDRFCSALGREHLAPKAHALIDRVKNTGSPCVTAAAAIYVAAILEEEKITQKEIHRVLGVVTEAALRARARKMLSELRGD